MDENDVRHSAHLLIQEHGAKAAEIVAAKVVEAQRADDGDNMTKWIQVLLAIRELTQDGHPDEGPIN